MRETRSSGSVRGASGDGRPYRERIVLKNSKSGLTKNLPNWNPTVHRHSMPSQSCCGPRTLP